MKLYFVDFDVGAVNNYGGVQCSLGLNARIFGIFWKWYTGANPVFAGVFMGTYPITTTQFTLRGAITYVAKTFVATDKRNYENVVFSNPIPIPDGKLTVQGYGKNNTYTCSILYDNKG